MSDEREIVKKLLGEVTVPDKYEYDLEWIKLPFEQAWSVVYCFCEKCGGMIEVGVDSAEQLCRLAGIPVLSDYSRVHFVAYGCPFCTEDGNYKSARVIREQ